MDEQTAFGFGIKAMYDLMRQPHRHSHVLGFACFQVHAVDRDVIWLRPVGVLDQPPPQISTGVFFAVRPLPITFSEMGDIANTCQFTVLQ